MNNLNMPPEYGGRAWIEIDLDALAFNAAEIRSYLPDGCKLMAVIKTNAYGHGMIKCVARLHEEGIDEFAVATVMEGVLLRESFSDIEILVLGYTHPKDAHFLHTYRLSQIIVDGAHAKELDEKGFALRVHIGIDTGMCRLGILAQNLGEIESVFSRKNLIVDGIATHFAVADSLDKADVAFTKSQIDSYYSVVESLRSKGHDVGKLHMQASYGIFNLPNIKCDYVRAGIALYGALGNDNEVLVRPNLRQVLSLRAIVAQVRWVDSGKSVSYGRTFKAESPTKVATVSIGYADGVPRQMSGKDAMVIVNGKKVPIIGRICMDMLMIDVTEADDVKTGDIVTFIGRDGDEVVLCEDLAAASNTITNDILCRLGGRLPRIYLCGDEGGG
ncbi:MAG: serine racemase VanT catalytic subunit [Oscillospiraceae bacterium]|nr:serine racemase VanT catalytic subunit [Oscillospiraceae bacterium]